ncbi:MAG: hypothetical protein ACRDPO_01095 [Streptosporangiaceae bacterium]
MTATTEETARVSAETPATIPVHGIVDVTDGRGCLRTAGYRRSPADIALTPAQLGQYGLRKGDQIEATIAPQSPAGSPRNSKNARNPRDAKNARDHRLAGVTSVSGLSPEAARRRPHFDDLTPIYPSERLRLEAGDTSPTARSSTWSPPSGKASGA